MFNLDQAIKDWRRQMLAADIKAPVPLDELEIHLREEIDQQMKSGLNAQEAFEAASRRLGQASELKTEFSKADAGTPVFGGLFTTVGMIFLAFIAALNIFGAGDYGSISGWRVIGTIDFLLLSLVLPLMAGFGPQDGTGNSTLRAHAVWMIQLLVGLAGLLLVFCSRDIGDGLWVIIVSCLMFAFSRRLRIRSAVALSIVVAGLTSAVATRILFWRPALVDFYPSEQILGLVGIGLGVVFLCSWPFSYRFLPVVSRKPMRRRIQLAFGALFVAWCVTSSNYITAFYNGVQTHEWVVALVWTMMIPLGLFGGIASGTEEAVHKQIRAV